MAKKCVKWVKDKCVEWVEDEDGRIVLNLSKCPVKMRNTILGQLFSKGIKVVARDEKKSK